MMTKHLSKVEADVQRVSKLMRDFGLRCYNEADESGHENFRFEMIGIVAVVSYETEDGDTVDDNAAVFESTRHHVQTGMLVDLLTAHLQHRRIIEVD